MDRPRLFLSAVSEELRTARQAVARTVRTLGFDPVSQDDFPTGHGELRQWLREQLDSCEGLIQLVGDGYGAEPPEVDPRYDRISYTQFEFLYAYKQKKKTWIIVIDKDFKRDKPSDQLDLPRDAGHHDPTGHQVERRRLQHDYLARLKQQNHLRHAAKNEDQLELIVRRMRDELGELRLQWEEWEKRIDTRLDKLAEAAQITTEKIRAHLLQTAEETHRRELAEAEQAPDWRKREQLREVAENAHRVRESRIDELANSFAEIEGRGKATSVFQEMTRILAEQGVDESIAYMESRRGSVLQTARSCAAAVRERNRADLEPLLRTAALYQTKDQDAEARALYTDILAIEPDWPEALHATFWFLTDQGDLARIRTTLAAAQHDYEEASRIVQRLTNVDSSGTQWQRDLSVSHDRIGDVLVAQGDGPGALAAYRKGLAIREALATRDPANTQWQRDLIVSYVKLSEVTGDKAYVSKALEIAQAMQKRGTLQPRDTWMVDELKRRLS